MLLYIFVFLFGLYNNQIIETISRLKTIKNTNDAFPDTYDSDNDSDTYPEIENTDNSDQDVKNQKSKILNFFKNLK